MQPEENGIWKVLNGGESNVCAIFFARSDAIYWGKQVARDSRPSQLIIYDLNGRIQKTYTYKDKAKPQKINT